MARTFEVKRLLSTAGTGYSYIINRGTTVNNSIRFISGRSEYFSFNSPKKILWNAHRK